MERHFVDSNPLAGIFSVLVHGVTPDGLTIYIRVSTDETDIAICGSEGVGKTAFIDAFETGAPKHGDTHDEIEMDVDEEAGGTVSAMADADDAPKDAALVSDGVVSIDIEGESISFHFVEGKDPSDFADVKEVDAAIIMFDTTSRLSYKQIPDYFRYIRGTWSEHIPVVLVGNKVDLRDRKVKPRMITFHRKKNLRYFDVSVRGRYNVAKPICTILAKIGCPEVLPEDIPLKRLSPEELAPVDEASVYDQRVEEIPLPEDDDDF